MASFSNHYATLGLNSSATQEEIRRAYRILARRYHPDVNPGKSSEEKFKSISEAYHVLSDQQRRSRYDIEYESALRQGADQRIKAYARQARDQHTARKRYEASMQKSSGAAKQSAASSAPKIEVSRHEWLRELSQMARRVPKILSTGRKRAKDAPARPGLTKVSVIEVSLGIKDAILGQKKALEISEPEGTRKVSVRIPPGVRNGAVLRLRSKSAQAEELVIVVRVASHPFMSIQSRGLVEEIPLSVGEALNGANITVPTLDDAMVIKVPAGTQSGDEQRLKERGILGRDGVRGDLILRFMIKIPFDRSAVGLAEKVAEVEQYYGASVRQTLPKNLLDV